MRKMKSSALFALALLATAYCKESKIICQLSKITKVSFIFLVLLSVLITSCVNNNENRNKSKSNIDRLTFTNDENNPLDEIHYKAANIIALETNDESLLSGIMEVRPYLSYLYILNNSGTLFVFDTNGKFVNQVGRKGNGPDEYLKLSSFFINKDEDRIVVIDDFKNKMYNYDLTGNFVNSNSTSPSIKYSNYSMMTKEGNVLLNYLVNFENNEAYSLIDGEDFTKNVYLKSYAPIEVEGYLYSFSSHPMSESSDGKINFIMPLCDTIFEYSNRQYYPKYVVDASNIMVDRELFKTNTTDIGASYPSMLSKYGRDGYFTGFNGIFETNEHILLKYRYNGFLSGFYIANKKSLEGDYYSIAIPEHPTKIPFYFIVGSNDNEFIGTVNAPDMISMYDDLQKNASDETLSSLKKAVDRLEEESNPCLIFYSFE